MLKDESKFTLYRSDGCQCVYQRRGGPFINNWQVVVWSGTGY